MTKIYYTGAANAPFAAPTPQPFTLRYLRLALSVPGVLLSLSSPAFCSPILSEIHYNGIASGADPDEFIELSNASESSLNLAGWEFTQGISYAFEDDAILAPATSLVLARDPSEFRRSFSGYTGALFDFSGALSNSGETLTLTDPDGVDFWSVTYGDSGIWPEQADGLGSSLQLTFGSLNDASANNWFAQAPTPGRWDALITTTVSQIPTPPSIALFVIGALILRSRHRKRPS